MSSNGVRQQSGADEYDPDSITVAEALQRMRTAIQPVTGFERLPLRDALGLVMAEPIRSPINVPSHTNSAMDGYALKFADLSEIDMTDLKVVGTAWAGRPHLGIVETGQCVRIMTGAVMPRGTDTVLMQEHVEQIDDSIRTGGDVRCGQHVRAAGEDVTRGDTVIAAGTLLRPSDIGVLASIGVAEVKVHRRIRVAFFSTGDELRSLGQPIADGEVYDSNRYTLYGMLTRLGVELIDMGVVRDDRDATREAFSKGASVADAIVTSAGASVGEADFIKEILEELGSVNFWKIAMKPGRPLAFGRVNNAWFFGLPGNPVSVMVTFYEFVQPALRRLMGQREVSPVRVKVRCASDLRKRPGRTEFQRGVVAPDANGELVVRSTGEQGSGILSSMSTANCFIVLANESGDVEAGSLVEIEPFDGLH